MFSLESQAWVLKGDESFFLFNLQKKVNCFAQQKFAKRKTQVSRGTASKTTVENGFLDICLEPRKHCLLEGKVLCYFCKSMV